MIETMMRTRTLDEAGAAARYDASKEAVLKLLCVLLDFHSQGFSEDRMTWGPRPTPVRQITVETSAAVVPELEDGFSCRASPMSLYMAVLKLGTGVVRNPGLNGQGKVPSLW